MDHYGLNETNNTFWTRSIQFKLTFSNWLIEIPIATEMNNLLEATDLTSCNTLGTTPGLTETKTTSDPCTTGEFSVIV